MSDDRPAVFSASSLPTVVLARISAKSWVAHFAGHELCAIRSTKAKALGSLVQTAPERFGLNPPRLFNLCRSSEEIGTMVLGNPDGFGVTLDIREELLP